MTPVVLIMTATVTPPSDAPGLSRTDPLLRMQDYIDALDFYIGMLGTVFDRIILVDNSGTDCTPIVSLAAARNVSDKVDVISYDGLNYPADYGRCYGEMRLIHYAMNNPLLTVLPEGTIFWKVTGRYKVRNMRTLVRARPRNIDLYCDLRVGSSPWFDMRVMSWTRQGFESVLDGIHEHIREDTNFGRPGEETAYREIWPRIGGARVKLSLNREPLIDGIRAFDNKNWDHGRQRVVYYLRKVQRLVLRRVII